MNNPESKLRGLERTKNLIVNVFQVRIGSKFQSSNRRRTTAQFNLNMFLLLLEKNAA